MNRRLVLPVAAAVIAIWLIGTWVTKYSLEQMAFFAPLAVVVVGATIGLVLLWVKVALESFRGRNTGRDTHTRLLGRRSPVALFAAEEGAVRVRP